MNNETQELLRNVPSVVNLAIQEIEHNCKALNLGDGMVAPFVLPIPAGVRGCVQQVCKAGGGPSKSVKSLFAEKVQDELGKKGYKLKVKYRWRKLDFTLA